MVEAALQERAIDVHDRTEAAFCHAARERHRVRLTDARVEEPRREILADATELVPLAHRRRQHADLFIELHRVIDRVAHDVRVRLRR